MKRRISVLVCLAWLSACLVSPAMSAAFRSKDVKGDFQKAFLGKDVKALLDMPAYKDGLDLYVNFKAKKQFDSRGIDLKDLSKYLKEKGVGVERDEWVTITDVKVDSDRIEIQLGGGGEGRGASKNASKNGEYKRAGGSRINFRYERNLTDADLQVDAFLPLLGRVVDTSKILGVEISKDISPEFQ